MILNVLVELVDFVFKAVVHYGRTPEGQAEFEQIYEAAQQTTAQEAGLTGNDGPSGSAGSTLDEARAKQRASK